LPFGGSTPSVQRQERYTVEMINMMDRHIWAIAALVAILLVVMFLLRRAKHRRDIAGLDANRRSSTAPMVAADSTNGGNHGDSGGDGGDGGCGGK
jgi:hypothetical protein